MRWGEKFAGIISEEIECAKSECFYKDGDVAAGLFDVEVVHLSLCMYIQAPSPTLNTNWCGIFMSVDLLFAGGKISALDGSTQET
jgi:hypothetical protein